MLAPLATAAPELVAEEVLLEPEEVPDLPLEVVGLVVLASQW
jgi:hypothetical protein